MSGLNLTIIKETKLRLPPIVLQNKFVIIHSKIDHIKSSVQQNLTELENLYGSLSQQAFKGELDLSRIPLASEEAAQQEPEQATISSQNLPKNIEATLADLNSLNGMVSQLKEVEDAVRSTALDFSQLEAIKNATEQMAAFTSPLQELEGMSKITRKMTEAQTAFSALNLDGSKLFGDIARQAQALTASFPKLDLSLLMEDQTVALKNITAPFDEMQKVIKSISLPPLEVPHSINLANETAKRLQASIPDFNTWHRLERGELVPDIDDEQEAVKRPFTREDIIRILVQTTKPLCFNSLLEELGKLETVDLIGYENIKEVLFQLFAEQLLFQYFDEEQRTLLLLDHNPDGIA